MEPYGNQNNGSDILAFEIGDDSIALQFKDSSIYLYTVQSIGPKNIAAMKYLATNGKGLDRFIHQIGKYKYAKRLIPCS